MALGIVAGVALVNTAHTDDSRASFLSQVLTHDFQGDGSYRVGKVIWTSPAKAVDGDCDCSEPREMFTAWDSPIVIVSTWKLIGFEQKSATDAVGSAEFHVLATTMGDGDYGEDRRKVVPLVTPNDERVTYRLKLKSGKWFVVDPPLPRVAIGEVVNQLAASMRRLPLPERRTKPIQDVYEWRQNQLDVLETLRSQSSLAEPDIQENGK